MERIKRWRVVLTDDGMRSDGRRSGRQDIQKGLNPSELRLIAERGYMTGEWSPPRIFTKQNKKGT